MGVGGFHFLKIAFFTFGLSFCIERNYLFQSNSFYDSKSETLLIPFGITNTSFSTTTSYNFFQVTIGGKTSPALHFNDTGFLISTAYANGGGLFVNKYSFVIDINIDVSMGTRRLSLINSYPDNGEDGNIGYVEQGIGIGDGYQFAGNFPLGVWNRVVISVDLMNGLVNFYINGTKWYNGNGYSLDNAIALNTLNDTLPYAMLFAGYGVGGFSGSVHYVKFYDGFLTDAYVALLGDPTVTPIPVPVPTASTTIFTTIQTTAPTTVPTSQGFSSFLSSISSSLFNSQPEMVQNQAPQTDNTLAIGLGVGLGIFFILIILLVVGIVFLVYRFRHHLGEPSSISEQKELETTKTSNDSGGNLSPPKIVVSNPQHGSAVPKSPHKEPNYVPSIPTSYPQSPDPRQSVLPSPKTKVVDHTQVTQYDKMDTQEAQRLSFLPEAKKGLKDPPIYANNTPPSSPKVESRGSVNVGYLQPGATIYANSSRESLPGNYANASDGSRGNVPAIYANASDGSRGNVPAIYANASDSSRDSLPPYNNSNEGSRGNLPPSGIYVSPNEGSRGSVPSPGIYANASDGSRGNLPPPGIYANANQGSRGSVPSPGIYVSANNGGILPPSANANQASRGSVSPSGPAMGFLPPANSSKGYLPPPANSKKGSKEYLPPKDSSRDNLPPTDGSKGFLPPPANYKKASKELLPSSSDSSRGYIPSKDTNYLPPSNSASSKPGSSGDHYTYIPGEDSMGEYSPPSQRDDSIYATAKLKDTIYTSARLPE